MAIIEVSDLTKKYRFGKVRGVEGMSFSVNEGELFGFIGPNGAGKSTTIRILMNFIRPDSGSARIFGMDCQKNSTEIKRHTGYMPSDVRFYPTATGGELLDYACKLRHHEKGLWKPLAERFGFDPKKQFRELSVGNRRKLSIIQALMGEPKLLILDEPTSGLDPIMQEVFFNTLRTSQQHGATVFFSSHNLSEVQRFCDRVALVKDGRLELLPDTSSLPMHRVELVTASDCAALLSAVNAESISKTGGKLRFMVKDDMLQTLLKMCATLDVRDITITRPALEELFHDVYYGKDEHHAGI